MFIAGFNTHLDKCKGRFRDRNKSLPRTALNRSIRQVNLKWIVENRKKFLLSIRVNINKLLSYWYSNLHGSISPYWKTIQALWALIFALSF